MGLFGSRSFLRICHFLDAENERLRNPEPPDRGSFWFLGCHNEHTICLHFVLVKSKIVCYCLCMNCDHCKQEALEGDEMRPVKKEAA